MVRIGISVEGQTEEIFVKKVLAPYLAQKNLFMTPICMQGDVNIDKVRSELKKIANNFDYVTTFYDFYGFKNKVAGETKLSLEMRILNAVGENIRGRLIPFVQMYEFEGILFSCPKSFALIMRQANLKEWADGLLQEFRGDPEKINNSPQTAPSKRIMSVVRYRKTTHGPRIAEAIGVEAIRNKCSGFNEWLHKIEKINDK
ncbi:DUF4276 family protein [Pseudoalteromonas sp. SWN29]|uniref:DUF4276 family protein n=1 Tax=Pseudoalteromonas sp. SWN29 TaxID=2792064 RepID=UPI0018CF0D1D|nr:DUF4276 family protein [Pseudoalteromonas sp. SWN29]MBH0027758.1 DUF4276 family protein [Pseudoalteromonas sp. SWN29]